MNCRVTVQSTQSIHRLQYHPLNQEKQHHINNYYRQHEVYRGRHSSLPCHHIGAKLLICSTFHISLRRSGGPTKYTTTAAAAAAAESTIIIVTALHG